MNIAGGKNKSLYFKPNCNVYHINLPVTIQVIKLEAPVQFFINCNTIVMILYNIHDTIQWNGIIRLTCSRHGHGEGEHEVPGADLAGVVGVQGAEDVPQHNISVTPWEDFPHHLHDLGLGEFSLREANLEGAPELHDLLVSQSLPLQQLGQSVLSHRTPVSTTGLVIFRLRSSLSSSTFLAFRERRCGWTCGISLFIVTESIKVFRFSGISSSCRLCLDRFFLIWTMLGQSSHSHPRTTA